MKIILVQDPVLLHQDQVCLDWFKQLRAAKPFQCLIISIMNDVETNFAWYIATFHIKIECVWIGSSIYPLLPLRLNVLGLILVIHRGLTLLISHYNSDEWLHKIEIVLISMRTQYNNLTFESWGGGLHFLPPLCVWVSPSISLQLDSSNITLWLYWMVIWGWDWNLSSAMMVPRSYILSHWWII